MRTAWAWTEFVSSADTSAKNTFKTVLLRLLRSPLLRMLYFALMLTAFTAAAISGARFAFLRRQRLDA